MLAGKRARLVEQLAEIQDSIDFVDAKQRFYDDVLSGATPYVSVLIPSAALAKESEEPGGRNGSVEPISSPPPSILPVPLTPLRAPRMG